ncbi:MAG: ThuA domain-containing protein [Clostridia bacterium]|nr:ThuA domain-containing protein [Clostridia bacterium]
MIRVLIWNEYHHERYPGRPSELYPDGMHMAIARGIGCDDFEIRTATLQSDEFQGLSEEALSWADVLIYWAHCRHDDVRDETAQRVASHVRAGMGFVALHSTHGSKVFRLLMGTDCTLRWRNMDEREHLWLVNPAHPIANGIPAEFALGSEEMYGEYFDIPKPDDIVFLGWFKGGNVFRSGCEFTRGYGKIFYFQPGHETCPTYHNENVLKVISNAVRYCARKNVTPCKAGYFDYCIEDL